jgi:hypothetical protein
LKTVQLISALFLLTASLTSCAVNDTQQMVQHVVVIGVDGMSPDGIKKAKTPHLDKLIATGAHTFHARAVLPTSSSSNWASMIMGAGPEQHGITSNGWERDDYILPAVISGEEESFPTIFNLLKDQKPGTDVGVIYHWKGFGRLFEKSCVTYDKHGPTEAETAQLASDYFTAKKPVMMFVHLDHVDGAGHHYGHGSKEYYASVERADSLIGDIVGAVENAGLLSKTLILVTSDHGGIGYGHGGETLAEIEIPFILSGALVKKGHEIKHAVNTYDNAATVAFALGLKQPYAWVGRPVKSAFTGYEVPQEAVNMSFMGPPVIHPQNKGYDVPGGLFIDATAQVEITSDIDNAEIYYTTDGSKPNQTSARYSEPFAINTTTIVKARQYADGKSSPEAVGYFRLAKEGRGHGLNYRYFEGEGWQQLPDFAALKSKTSGRAWEFRLEHVDHRPEYFAIEFEGYVALEEAGQYTFYTNSDDGSQLFIGTKMVVDNDGDHGVKMRSGKIELDKGRHPIRVTYYNGGGGKWLDVYYKGPGIEKQILPANVLFSTK